MTQINKAITTQNSIPAGIKVIAIIFFVIAGITIFMGSIYVFIALITSIGDSLNSRKDALFGVVFGIIFFLICSSFLSSGIGLLNKKKWGKILAIILLTLILILCLIVFFGTIIYDSPINFLYLSILLGIIFASVLHYLLFNKKVKECFL